MTIGTTTTIAAMTDEKTACIYPDCQIIQRPFGMACEHSCDEENAMKTKDERKQIQNFETAITDVIDIYLKEGMDPDDMRSVLQEQITSDLHGRRTELDTA